MDWHSTNTREELILVLRGRVDVEVEHGASGKIRSTALQAGRSVFLPSDTPHRVVNRSRAVAIYIYVTAPGR